jgi:hypothetical protein
MCNIELRKELGSGGKLSFINASKLQLLMLINYMLQ